MSGNICCSWLGNAGRRDSYSLPKALAFYRRNNLTRCEISRIGLYIDYLLQVNNMIVEGEVASSQSR